jgi:hypoxanthine phosphoribosyltransferase
MKVFKDTEKVLIVDDLLDSGETIKIVKNCFVLRKAGDVKVAVLLKKPTSCIEPDFCVRHNVTSWVQFHWEDEHGHHNTVCDTPHSAS